MLSSDAEKFKEQFEECQKMVRAAKDNEENDSLTSDLKTLTLEEEEGEKTAPVDTSTTTNSNADPE